ncbi:MAG: RtcB family protein [Phycisphaerae bacterium]|nr:RtcB family protein [Phycisphaerae bacterium]
MPDVPLAPMCAWTVDGIPADAKRALERIRRSDDVERVAVLPDVHVAGETCVGVAAATTRLLYPALVGQDIGCGLATIAFDAEATSLDGHRETLLRALLDAVPIIQHRSGEATLEHVDPTALSDRSLATLSRRDGAREFGTLGRGNHFVEFERDAEDRLWLLVHSGSRVMGEAITRLHVARAEPRRGGLVALDATTDAGAAYASDVAWARAFARESRRRMLLRVSSLVRASLGVAADDATHFDCDHNHVASVTVDGRALLVHRKGASSAALGEPALIPGAMGRESMHVTGRGVDASLHSSSHGAGRVMSRGRARHAIAPRALDASLASVTVARSIRGRLAEESAPAYRDIQAVMRAQRELVRTVRVVRGFVVHRACPTGSRDA